MQKEMPDEIRGKIERLKQSARESAAFDYDRRRRAKDFPEWQEAEALERAYSAVT